MEGPGEAGMAYFTGYRCISTGKVCLLLTFSVLRVAMIKSGR